jgi:transposase
MAVRGLGCSVRFTLTAGQKGDAPQAATLIEGLPAEVVMADTAYDADHLRQAIAAKGALAVIPNNPSRALKYPLDKLIDVESFGDLAERLQDAGGFPLGQKIYLQVEMISPFRLQIHRVLTDQNKGREQHSFKREERR